MLADIKAFNAVVRDGVLKAQVMPPFEKVVDEQQTEAIRAYIIDQANMPELD